MNDTSRVSILAYSGPGSTPHEPMALVAIAGVGILNAARHRKPIELSQEGSIYSADTSCTSWNQCLELPIALIIRRGARSHAHRSTEADRTLTRMADIF